MFETFYSPCLFVFQQFLFYSFDIKSKQKKWVSTFGGCWHISKLVLGFFARFLRCGILLLIAPVVLLTGPSLYP